MTKRQIVTCTNCSAWVTKDGKVGFCSLGACDYESGLEIEEEDEFEGGAPSPAEAAFEGMLNSNFGWM